GLVVLAVLGGEHEDRHLVAGGAQGGADPVAVQAGQHDVEDQQVVAALGGPVQALGAVVDDVHGVALGRQTAGEGQGEAFLGLRGQQSGGTARSGYGGVGVAGGWAHAYEGRRASLKSSSGGSSFLSASVGDIEVVEQREPSDSARSTPTREESS